METVCICHPAPVTFLLDPEETGDIIQCMLNYFPGDPALSPVDLQQLSTWLNVLAEPKRLLIFNLLMQGVQCNCELGEKLHMSPNLISHHMSKLRAVGLVDMERDTRDARWVYYSVNRSVLDALNAAFGQFFDPQRIQVRAPSCGPQYDDGLISNVEIRAAEINGSGES